jgi:predicted alpha/beta-fold hydrolase
MSRLRFATPQIDPCRPPWWARGPHAQTLLGHLLPRRAPRIGGEAHELELGDGDRLVVFERAVQGSRCVVYLFHGLGGDSDADYVRGCAAQLPDCSIVAFNHRGCGAGRGLAKQPYHSGATGDLDAVLEWGRSRHPHALHIGIGFSLSGNTLLLLLARGGGPDAGIAVNPPIDLAAASDAISSGFNRLYDLRFVQQCRRDPRCRDVRIRPWDTLRRVDDLYTAPAAGFRDAAHYYAQCSAAPELCAIDRPAVILTAADDPLVPIESFRCVPDQVHLHVETHGGHLGYLDRSGRWLDRAIARYVAALIR